MYKVWKYIVHVGSTRTLYSAKGGKEHQLLLVDVFYLYTYMHSPKTLRMKVLVSGPVEMVIGYCTKLRLWEGFVHVGSTSVTGRILKANKYH